MAGTKEGGLKAAATNKKRYGKEWYKKIGAMGGKNGHTGGFAYFSHDIVSAWGKKGGSISRRSKSER